MAKGKKGQRTLAEISTKMMISNHYDNDFKQKTISARINAKYRGHKSGLNLGIKLRMETDKTIWISATKYGIPIAKVKITPNRVEYYEKIQRVYFDGDFALLSKWLGTDLDFEKVQNILLGQAILDLKKGKYNSKTAGNMYQLSPKKDSHLFGILFFLNPENYKMNKQEVRHGEKEQLLSVAYPEYQDIRGEQFPKYIFIKSVNEKKLTTIDLQYRSVEFNKELTFPFSTPKGYKEIRLK